MPQHDYKWQRQRPWLRSWPYRPLTQMIAKDACSMRQEKPRALPAANLWLAQNMVEFRSLKALRPRHSVLTAQDDTAPHKCPCAEFLQNPLWSSDVLSFRTAAQPHKPKIRFLVYTYWRNGKRVLKLLYACNNNHSGEASSPSIQLHRLAASELNNWQDLNSFMHKASYGSLLHSDLKITARKLP